MAHPLLRMYRILLEHYGPRGWWPGDSPFEVVVGAILTQNTAWANVEKAIANLKALDAMTPEGLGRLPEPTLRQAVRPSGYYNQKARRLRGFLAMLREDHDGRLEDLFALPTEDLREALLSVSGIGPETADSIVLYAAGRPIFVIDAYTLRVLIRHELLPEETTYTEAQAWVTDHLPEEVPLFNEFHALLVAVGKDHCKPRPRCEGCPLEGFR